MTEPAPDAGRENSHYLDAEQANQYANQARAAREMLDQFERQQARRRRIARWYMIPYALAGVQIGIGVSLVFGTGARLAGVLLVVGFVILLGCQWAVPILVQRERGEPKP